MLSQWIVIMTNWVILRELLFIVTWLWAGLLIDDNLGTWGQNSGSIKGLSLFISRFLVLFMSIASNSKMFDLLTQNILSP